jgi:hypothetical protein
MNSIHNWQFEYGTLPSLRGRHDLLPVTIFDKFTKSKQTVKARMDFDDFHHSSQSEQFTCTFSHGTMPFVLLFYYKSVEPQRLGDLMVSTATLNMLTNKHFDLFVARLFIPTTTNISTAILANNFFCNAH